MTLTWPQPAPPGQKLTVLLYEGCLYASLRTIVINIYEAVELCQRALLNSALWDGELVIGFKTRPLYPRGKCVRFATDAKPSRLQSWSGRFREEKNKFHLPGTKPQFVRHQTRSPVTIPFIPSPSSTDHESRFADLHLATALEGRFVGNCGKRFSIRRAGRKDPRSLSLAIPHFGAFL
jgi:hypothetical protein